MTTLRSVHQKTCSRSRRPMWIIDWMRLRTVFTLSSSTSSSSSGSPVERHRLAEVQRGTSPAAARRRRTAGTARSGTPAMRIRLRERLEVDRRRLLLGADHRDRHDRRAGLEREPHEAVAELGELVALRERLRDAARAFGEHQHRLVGREQAAAVLRRAGDLAPAREQIRRERHASGRSTRPSRAAGAAAAARGSTRRRSRRRRTGAGRSGSRRTARGRDVGQVLDPERSRAEVVAVQPARDGRGAASRDSRDSPNGSKPNSLPCTTSAWLRPSTSSQASSARRAAGGIRSRRPTGGMRRRTMAT